MSTFRVFTRTFVLVSAVLCGALILYVLVLAVINAFGPSTRYIDPEITTAKIDEKGRRVVYLGDNFVVSMTVVRHPPLLTIFNSNCTFAVRRYAEAIGGSRHGWRYMFSTARLHFRGADDRFQTQWPVPSRAYAVGFAYEREAPGRPYFIDHWTAEDERDHTLKLHIPLLTDGVEEQNFGFYAVGRYFCNDLDYYKERYIQGGDRHNTTPWATAIVKRAKP